MRSSIWRKTPENQPSEIDTLHNPALRIIYICGAPHSVELGVAWKPRSGGEELQDYLNVVLDVLSFPEPIRTALFEEDSAVFWYGTGGIGRFGLLGRHSLV
ncbi:hypothetical protein GCM10010869_49700 [Mesorhizobium tianshanense]|uniref:Uncharacterized protein DUF736 n=1 Tax=Mesorhizobium tianshanense TaxID=39844 RepID=A0A562ML35_9HYPH|nr:DUF736 family protein [Mesorhizobium tianshanense]TWI20614.1 uncharacterized protein DUF736 [Mesorhizobium tianshanense]GLS39373.1 hypothetical protein GCM10010869_49700 [Mesorhizobium tianshanense]